MKILYTLVLFFCILQFSFAQEQITNKLVFPQFEVCEADDQSGRACFENMFTTKFKTFYKETEIASDYLYYRALIGDFQVDRRGKIIQKGFNSAESPIFVSIERAIQKFDKLKPSNNDKNRPEDFSFQIKFILLRSVANSEDALDVEVEFIYPNSTKENL